MGTRPKTSEYALMDQFEVALVNATKQPVIAAAMDDNGYDEGKIAEGNDLIKHTWEIINTSRRMRNERKVASVAFSKGKARLHAMYKKHRRKARLVYKNDRVTQGKLVIAGRYPRTYIRWYSSVRKFYEVGTKDEKVSAGLARLKVTASDLAAGKKLHKEVKLLRAKYVKAKGVSENATQQKHKAIAEMSVWMSEFYEVARIALEEQPQMLEVLGKKVKS